MQKQGIYIFTNLVNNKVYIGSSLNLDKRCYEHYRLLRLNQHENKHFQAAWNKYGEENFEYRVLKEVDLLESDEENNQNLRSIETDYIQQYKSYDSNYGYNFIPGGIGTQNLPCSEEKKQKISKANKNREAYNKGVPMSEEQKELLRKIQTEKHGKAIDIYNIDGTFRETLPSVREVHRVYGVGRNTIVDCCKNLTNPIKYIFRYHGDSLDTVGSEKKSIKDTLSKDELEQRAKKYRESYGKKIDVYDRLGNFIETLPALISVCEKYNLSEATVRIGIKNKGISGGMFFRNHGEPLENVEELIRAYKPTTSKSSNLCFLVYCNNELVDILKYKKDVEKYAKYREKSKLQKLLINCSKCGDSFTYHEFFIKLDLAPDISNNINELRQLDPDSIEGTISANGEA